MRSLVWSMIVRFNGSYAPRGSGSVVPSVNCTDDLPTQRIRRRNTHQPFRALQIKAPGIAEGLMRIPLANIRYLDVRRNYVTVHADRDYTVKRSII